MAVVTSQRGVAVRELASAASMMLMALLSLAVARADEPLDFATDVAPVLQAHCIRCHQPGIAKGDLSLATGEDLAAQGHVVAGEPDASYLIEVISASASGEAPQMPKEGSPLSAKEVDLLRRWITEGAEWPAEVVLREASKADKSWWSLQPLQRVEPPMPDGLPQGWEANPIDRFVFARLQEQGLVPNPPADKRELIRRVTYDLTGLPPTPDEVEAFLAEDSPRAYEQLVDRLLASPDYGEHWGRHWLDVVRFGESTGFERNVIVDNAWPFRDYIIRSFNEDKPFDQLVIEQLAGDVLGAGDPAVEVGTTFLVCGPYDNVGNQDPVQAAQIRANTIDDFIRATSETFLGLTIGCARCHDHKFDPISQEDYYRLYATFAGVHHGSRTIGRAEDIQRNEQQRRELNESREKLLAERSGLEQAILARAQEKLSEYERRWTRPAIQRTGVEERFSPVEARFVRFVSEGLDTNPGAIAGYRIDELEIWTAEEPARNVALLTSGAQAYGASRTAQDFADAYSPKLAIDGQYGAAWIASGADLTIELAQPERIERIVFSSDRSGAAGANPVATFVCEYRLEVSLDGQTWTRLLDSHDRQPVNEAHRNRRLLELEKTDGEQTRLHELAASIAELDRRLGQIPSPPSWWIGNFQTADGPFHVFVGGSPQAKGTEVVPASLEVLSEVTAGYQLDASGPESERRLKLAQWLIAPDNPLTPRVLANRVWQYHFGTGIVDTPSDFGYMGSRPTHPELLDWLACELQRTGWRLKPLHKQIVLSETYRQSSEYRPEAAALDADSRLWWRYPPRRLAAEEIRDTILLVCGKLDRRKQGPGFRLYEYLEDNVATYVPRDEVGPETYRRAVYHQNARASRVDVLSDFDCPDNAFAAPTRSTTTTPLQALTMLNHQFLLDMAAALANELRAEAGEDAGACVDRAFRRLYFRAPTDDERQGAVELINAHGLRAFCRALLNSNELIYVD